MRILLVGEYSLLHNSLKEGLIQLGHNVQLVGNSDGFKQYPVDFDFEAKVLKSNIFNLPRKITYKLFGFDLAEIEYGIRFFIFLPKFKNYDVVQFINEASIKTFSSLELYLIKYLTKNNQKKFLISSGIDFGTLKFYLDNPNYKSILNPYIKNKTLSKEFLPFFKYFSKGHEKIHAFMHKNFNGLIATDFDYVSANKNFELFSKFIPYPINFTKLPFEELIIRDKVIIFLGINKYSYNQKGIVFFEKALQIIKEKYPEKVEIIITNTIPYNDYIKIYNSCHILLDQLTCNDQGYNALEAMAKGKVVFTGAEQEFTDYYKITDSVCINAKPDVDHLVQELSFLIENPEEIIAIGKRARAFVEKEHNYIKIAEKYLAVWNNN